MPIQRLSAKNAAPTGPVTPAHAGYCGVIAFMLGTLAALGLAFHIPVLVSLRPDWSPMALNTAICFMLSGGALMLHFLPPAKAAIKLRSVLGGAICLIAVVVVLELAFGTAWTEYTSWPARFYPQVVNAGQMSPVTAVSFLLVGSALFLLDRLHYRAARRSVRTICALLFIIGIGGMLNYLLSLEFLHSLPNMKRMAFQSSFGLTVLAAGIWLVRRNAADIADQKKNVVDRIYFASDVILAAIVAVVSFVSFALAQSQAEKLMAEQMHAAAIDRRLLFDNIITQRVEIAALISTRPALTAVIREARRNLKASGTSERLNASAASYLQHGFSALAFATEDGRTMGMAGQFTADPEIRIPVAGRYPAELFWRDGFLLYTRLPMRDAAGPVGYAVAEQRLTTLTELHAAALRHGTSGDLAICGLRGNDQICFPIRSRSKPSTVPAYLDGKPLPVTRAVLGETTTVITVDFRRERVMAAIGPIGATGLGMAVKMDMAELYEPVRTQFLHALPFFALLLGASVWLMRMGLRPLVRALDNSRKELAFTARHDTLTGLPNRGLFFDRLTQAMLRAKRTKKPMALMYLDIDHFKQINDRFGHHAGDDVLCWFSALLRKSVRAADTVARLGGDEFTIILEGLDKEGTERIARDIQQAVATTSPPLPNNNHLRVGTSIGVTLYHGELLHQEDLLQRADAALYKAKQGGRNTYVIS